jgi:hypothetical protein
MLLDSGPSAPMCLPMRNLIPVFRRAFASGLLALAAVAQAASLATAPAATGAGALRAKYGDLRESLERNAFGRPVHLMSKEGPHVLEGDIHAVVQHAFPVVSESLHRPGNWCDILIMPFNTKLCTTSPRGDALTVFVGRKNDVEPRDAYRLDFSYRVAARTADYLRIELRAPEGPLGTRDYVITLEAAPLDGQRSLIHLSYNYAYGTISRVAMQAYLATVGRSKVGFSQVEHDGRTELVRGMRGIMERNTMRYYLAIEAYLGALSTPNPERVEKRLADWYAAQARYPRQLREMDRDDYMAMKHREIRRMHAELARAG